MAHLTKLQRGYGQTACLPDPSILNTIDIYEASHSQIPC